MVTCSVLTQNPVYDEGIENKLDKSISKVIRKDDTIRFLLCSYNASNGCFLDLFSAAAYRAKLANPHKDIRLSVVVLEDERGPMLEALRNWRYDIPSFMVDEILSKPLPEGLTDSHAIVKQMQRWTVEQSDYIFTYLYNCLYETNSLALDYASKLGKNIIDLTEPSTYDLIHEKYSILPERVRTVMELWLGGKPAPEIAKMLGTSKNRPHQLIYEGSRKIRENLRGQENHPPEAVCTVFLLGPATYDTMTALHKTADYLIRHKNVKTFLVAANYLASPFRFALEKLTSTERGIQAIYLDADLKEKNSPPAINIASVDLKTYPNKLVERYLLDEAALAQIAAPYCICSLAFCGDEMAKQIQGAFLSDGSGVSMFCDLSKSFPGRE